MKAEIPVSPLLDTPKTRVAWPHIVLGVLGIALSCYAIWAHFRIEAGQSTGCGISESISCDAVIGSKWGKFFGIPLGYYGLVYWGIVIVTAISGAATSVKMAALQRLGVATVGIVFSAGLFYISEFIIHKTCPICLSTHTTSLVNFIFAVVLWRRAARASHG